MYILSTDYVVTGVSPLTFTESGTQTISVAIVDDMVFEDTESFSIVLSNPQPGSVMLNPDTITITITDDDALRECLHKHMFMYMQSCYGIDSNLTGSMHTFIYVHVHEELKPSY